MKSLKRVLTSNERDWEVYLTNGDEKNKNLKYFQGAIEKDILMEKLKE